MQQDEFSKLPQASFGGVVFPLRSVKIISGTTLAAHKQPHRPGQRIEPMGREPITGVMVAPMFATLPLEANGRTVYWPAGVELLREKSQDQKPYPLVIPPFGTLERAYITLEEDYEATVRDGAYLTIRFVEDRGDLIAKGTKIPSAAKMSELADGLADNLAALQLKIAQKIEDAQGKSYTDIATAIRGFIALKDQAESSINDRLTMAGRIVGALDDLFKTAASTFSDPVNWETREQLRDLTLAVQDSVTDGQSAAAKIKAIVLAAESSVVDIATATGNTVQQVIDLNGFPDPGTVFAGEIVIVYEV